MNNAAIKTAVEGAAGINVRHFGMKLPAAYVKAIADIAVDLGVSKKAVAEAWRAE